MTPDATTNRSLPGRPRHAVPAGACDCHAHVFGPPAIYPTRPNPKYQPLPNAGPEEYDALHRRLGIDRGVLVQASIYGFDHACLIDAMTRIGPRVRGVGVIDPGATSDAEIERLHRAGIRGARLNIEQGLGLAALESLADRIRDAGWHLQLWVAKAEEWVEIETRLRKLRLPIVIDHMGRVRGGTRLDAAPVRTVMGLLADGLAWVKASWAESLSAEPYPYPDVELLAQALIAARPDRVLWGTDWPHPAPTPLALPDDARLLDLLGRWVPDEATRRLILVDNPARLYGFDAA